MELKGKIKQVNDTETVSDKFKKRDFIITTNDNPTYPQHISVQCTQDKVSMLDNLPVGTEVTAHINLRGREWTSPKGDIKFFNTIECWKLEVTGKVTPSPEKGIVEDHLPF